MSAARSLLGLAIALLPVGATAEPFWSQGIKTGAITVFSWDIYRYHIVTFTTTAITPGQDTVLHVLNSSGAEIAYNDDCPGNGLNSCATVNSNGQALVHATIIVHQAVANTSGYANIHISDYNSFADDLYEDDLTSMPIAAYISPPISTNIGDTVRATGAYANNLGHFNDPVANTVAYVVKGDTSTGKKYQIVSGDDDSGPNTYAKITEATAHRTGGTITYRLLAGAQFFGALNYYVTIDEAIRADHSNDPDQDGISTTLETLAGLNPNSSDTDGDGIPDQMEFFGNDGWSYSEAASPWRKDLFVELASMQDLASYISDADLSTIVTSFSNNAQATVHIFKEALIPYHAIVHFSNTTPPPGDVVEFFNLVTWYFAPANPEIRLYFYFWVEGQFIDKQFNNIAGISYQPGKYAAFSNYLAPLSWGVVQHEFGHNLGLSHNGNDFHACSDYSHAHYSIMNYYYSNICTPVATWPPARFSFGQNGCVACSTSPKYSCKQCLASTNCAGACASTCDCDVAEWQNLHYFQSSGGSNIISDANLY